MSSTGRGGGPRPLRSPDTPWALPNLNVTEDGQLEIGNILLQCSVNLILESIPSATSGVLEHPNCPQKGHIPAIWKLDILRRLALHNSSDQLSFLQGPLGQASPKPTRFHAVNLPELQPIIDDFNDFSRDFRGCQKQFDAGGTFAAAELKMYPPRMNGSFVLSFIAKFTKSNNMDADERLVFVAEARRTILDRYDQIDVEQCVDFVEQDLDSAISVGHPLHSFAAWPDKDTARGKDYAF